MRAAQFILFSLMMASQTAFAEMQYNLTPGVTPISKDIYDLHMLIFWVCVAIGVVVFGVIGYAILYHRKKKHPRPAQFHEHFWLEISWSIVPLLILIAMAIPATKVLGRMNDPSVSDLTIKITGYQWKWKYDYIDQNLGFFSNSATPLDQINNQAPKDRNYLQSVDHPLVVPIHKKIRLLVTSNDVIHSWWVPDFGVKRDALPGFINEAWMRINRPGVYHGQCSELCGMGHGFMPIVVIAMAENDFEDWLAMQQGRPPVHNTALATTTTVSESITAKSSEPVSKNELMTRGEKVYLATCAVCHQPTGAGVPPTFPALKGSKIVTGPVDAHLATVLNGRPGTAMQAFKDQLSDEDLAAVITYERNSWGNNTGDVVQPAQVKAARK